MLLGINSSVIVNHCNNTSNSTIHTVCSYKTYKRSMLSRYNFTDTKPNHKIPVMDELSRNAISISTSSNLSITMSLHPQAKPKERTKYRPIQRSDGVIVLQRPYRPVGSPPTAQASTFEKHLPIFSISASSPKSTSAISKPRKAASTTSQPEDLTSKGASLVEMGRHGYNDAVDAGRGGYNDLVDVGQGGYQETCDEERKGIEGIVDFLSTFSEHQKSHHTMPMQRFLGESGPWTACKLRNH